MDLRKQAQHKRSYVRFIDFGNDIKSILKAISVRRHTTLDKGLVGGTLEPQHIKRIHRRNDNEFIRLRPEDLARINICLLYTSDAADE